MQTQKAWLERNRNADIDLSLKEFRGALLRYGKGEAFVATALEAAGFIAPAEGSENMLLSVYLGQQEAMMEGDKEYSSDVKYSFQGVDEDSGLKIYRVDFGVGLSKTEKQTALAEMIRNV
ncbi:MAG: hypothetical protein IJD39_05155 [Clostridia bacterium]|nr:hypothetical protein [Clostridia bacterium]